MSTRALVDGQLFLTSPQQHLSWRKVARRTDDDTQKQKNISLLQHVVGHRSNALVKLTSIQYTIAMAERFSSAFCHIEINAFQLKMSINKLE